MDKNCLTCKYEPEWVKYLSDLFSHGSCKLIPNYFSANELEYNNSNGAIYVDHKTSEDEIVLDNCNLWQPK